MHYMYMVVLVAVLLGIVSMDNRNLHFRYYNRVSHRDFDVGVGVCLGVLQVMDLC
jgi:hypothetical protein